VAKSERSLKFAAFAQPHAISFIETDEESRILVTGACPKFTSHAVLAIRAFLTEFKFSIHLKATENEARASRFKGKSLGGSAALHFT